MFSTRRVVLVIVAAAVAAGLFFWMRQPSGPVALGAVLDNTLRSGTVQLRIVRDGAAQDVWVGGGGQARWEESSTKYAIARGPRLWRIDETANTIEDATSPWFDEHSRQVDLLRLIGVARHGSQDLRKLMDGTFEISGHRQQPAHQDECILPT